MKENLRRPNCLGFVIKSLGMGEDKYYHSSTTLELFQETSRESAEAAAVIIRGHIMHVIPYDDLSPNMINHRPSVGSRVRYSKSFFDALGYYVVWYPSSSEILYLKRKEVI